MKIRTLGTLKNHVLTVLSSFLTRPCTDVVPEEQIEVAESHAFALARARAVSKFVVSGTTSVYAWVRTRGDGTCRFPLRSALLRWGGQPASVPPAATDRPAHGILETSSRCPQ